MSPETSERSSSAATTAMFRSVERSSTRDNRARGASANRANQVLTTDRFLPVINNLEMQGMMDEQTGSLLKTLILEENIEVFKLINSYLASAITENILSAKLYRLAQQMGSYIDRP